MHEIYLASILRIIPRLNSSTDSIHSDKFNAYIVVKSQQGSSDIKTALINTVAKLQG